MRISASAPGKLMLFGEHAVLHGYPCLVTTVGLRYKVSIVPIDEPIIFIHTPALENKKEDYSVTIEDLPRTQLNNEDTKFILAVLKELMPSGGYRNGFKITTDGPVSSYGLGSSSAICSATVRALSKVLGTDLSKEEIFQKAYTAVLKVQGTGSGFDTAAATFGGTLRYQTGMDIRKLPIKELPLVIGFTGKKASTVDLVNKVDQQTHDELFQSIGEITESAETALIKEDWETLGILANKNQELLEALGVSTPTLEKGIAAARQAGAYGAKLSGAGGGDCMFAICGPSKIGLLEKELENAGLQVLKFETNIQGVRFE